MRLFYALELPSDIQTALGRLQSPDARDYRWVDPALMHLTLAFLGEQPEDQLSVLQRIGSDVASVSHEGVLRLGKAGSFGSRRAPRVLWIDLDGDVEALIGVQSRLAEQLGRAGFPLEDRPFAPHVTLARRRDGAQGGPPNSWPPEVPHAAIALDELALMQSRLSPRGPSYTPLAKFAIGS